MARKIRKVPPKDAFRDAILMNNETYIDYLERMKKICLSMFEWQNLPDTMNERFLEMCLYYKGQAALLKDSNYGYINTQAADSGYINIYGLPTLINCFSYSYNTQRNLYVPDSDDNEDDSCILVMNTFERVPTCATIELFAQRLADAQRLIDTNISAQRTPVLILTDKSQEFSLRNLYTQYDGNTPVIFANKDQLNPEAIRTINTEAPYIIDKVMNYKREIWNEFLTTIGVSNLSEKRERLVTAETDSNNELVNMNMQSFLIPRQKACEEFNKLFGLTGDKAISVRVRSDLYNIVKQYDSIADDYNLPELKGDDLIKEEAK